MSDLSQFIRAVLACRQGRKPRVQSARRTLDELTATLDRLADLAGTAVAAPNTPAELRQAAVAFSDRLRDLGGGVADLRAKLTHLAARFGKSTINIGVAGKARQGKSTLLQAISGLDDAAIPTSDGLPCTGAKSRIFHWEQEPHAIVDFYSQEEFLSGVVHAYYDELDLKPQPSSLADFRRPLPPCGGGLPRRHAVYKKLQELHDGLGEFQRYLSHRPGRIALDRVRDVVSQQDGRQTYLAVKCASIFVRFPNRDVSGLGVVDLPGLGEIAKGHSERLVASLQEEVDAVLLLKMPPDHGTHWDEGDYEVFNRVKQAVPEMDLADWLFVVLNETGTNAKGVEVLRGKPPDVGCALPILTANCSRRGEVDERVFGVVLKFLQANLDRIDRQYTARLSDQLKRLADDVETAVEPISQLVKKDIVDMDSELRFNRLCGDFLKQLRARLALLVEEYRKRLPDEQTWFDRLNPFAKAEGGEAPADEFRKAVEEACGKAEQAPPVLSAGQLREKFFDLGGWKAVVQEEMHHMRSHLTHQLAEVMDFRLAHTAEVARRDVVDRLLAEPLGRLLPPPVQAEADPRGRVKALCGLLSEKLQPTLTAALDYLNSFVVSYQTHFHYRVRIEMAPLDPMTKKGDFAVPGQGADASDKVVQLLTDRYRRVVGAVRERLRKELQYDSVGAVFAMIEATQDRLVRGRTVEPEWRTFLYLHRGDIWPEDFSGLPGESARRQQWQESLDSALRAAEGLRTVLEEEPVR
jgi:hypothetical protein